MSGLKKALLAINYHLDKKKKCDKQIEDAADG